MENNIKIAKLTNKENWVFSMIFLMGVDTFLKLGDFTDMPKEYIESRLEVIESIAKKLNIDLWKGLI